MGLAGSGTWIEFLQNPSWQHQQLPDWTLTCLGQAGVWKKQLKSFTFCRKLLCSLFLCSWGLKRKIKPSWKNQKADAPVIGCGRATEPLLWVLQALAPQFTWAGGAADGSTQMSGGKKPSWVAQALKPLGKPTVQATYPAWVWHAPPGFRSSHIQGCPQNWDPLSGGLRTTWVSRAHPREGRVWAEASSVSTAMTRCRILLSAIYHSDGKTN